MTIRALTRRYPYFMDFFDINALPKPESTLTLSEYFARLPYSFWEDVGMTETALKRRLFIFINCMEELRSEKFFEIESITILGGKDKNGAIERAEIPIRKGEIWSIVGPTGAGKSRLLADIEWMAQGDTPTGRRILVNDKVPPEEWRFSLAHKLVAQLSQNMNFVMDASVGEFVRLHAQSRMVFDLEERTEKIIREANRLSGEEIRSQTPLCSLSGGQSRALMVADTAFLSYSPIVLIDEIENAGINRHEALKLLAKENKIVIAATHDPLLALIADKRIVIRNGAIFQILKRDDAEWAVFEKLLRIDVSLMRFRDRLRNGDRLV